VLLRMILKRAIVDLLQLTVVCIPSVCNSKDSKQRERAGTTSTRLARADG
jgi:hypothetical protein